MAEVVTQAYKEALPKGIVLFINVPTPPPPLLSSLYLDMTLSTFADVDAGTKKFELAIAKEAKGALPSV